jgi:hypothetical protein
MIFFVVQSYKKYFNHTNFQTNNLTINKIKKINKKVQKKFAYTNNSL